MSAWWVVYNKIFESGNRKLLITFEYEYESIAKILKKFHEGITNNIEAKTEIRQLLEDIENPIYKEKKYLSVDILQEHIEKKIYRKIECETEKTSIFHWNYELLYSCETCNTVRGGLLRSPNIFYCGTDSDYTFTSFQEILDGSIKCQGVSLPCPKCEGNLKCFDKTSQYPHVLILNMPIITNRRMYKVRSIDRSIIFKDVEYELLAAVYGDDSHFVCRYVFGDNIYEADGMREYKLGDSSNSLHAAESEFVSNDFVKDMNLTIQNKLPRQKMKQVCEIYYIRKN